MRTHILLLLLLIGTPRLFAQVKPEFQSRFDKANKAYQEGNYFEALPMYLQLYKSDSANANISYLVGACYLQARSVKANAAPYLEKAVLSVTADYKAGDAAERNAPILAYKLLGDAYHLHSNFDKAIACYETYKRELLARKKNGKEDLKDANRKIEMCNTAKELIASPVRVKIENMGKALNSPYGDYSPVLTGDQSTMIFTSRRKESTGGRTYDGGRYYEDIYISTYNGTAWSTAQNIGSPVNTDENEASVGVSPDGQEILVYKDDNGDGNIYSTTLDGDVWTTPVKLNSNINTKSWEPSAFISANGQVIYFSSDRPGGYGGRDLYISYKTDKGDWGKAMNMGPLVNSPYDEDAPFIHPDGVTLFYSSNGHRTMGGFDVFYSTTEDGIKWSAPVNVGYPVNSPDDDIFYVVSTDKTKAYYSSFKEGGQGEKDNYIITFLDQKDVPLTMLKGTVKDSKGNIPNPVLITVTDNETGKVVGTYKANTKTGQYLFILTPGRNYNISYEAEGFLFYSENREIPKKTNYYESNKTIELPLVTAGAKIVLNNLFFDFDKSTLRKTSNVELKNILRFLNKYSKITVEIGGHTDSKGSDAYNVKLSQERADAVVAYLVANGIGKDRLVSKGYGETSPSADNHDVHGNDSAEGMQLNRCVELKILEVK